jgi:hypothetical protein
MYLEFKYGYHCEARVQTAGSINKSCARACAERCCRRHRKNTIFWYVAEKCSRLNGRF